jgi:hypothetical protein
LKLKAKSALQLSWIKSTVPNLDGDCSRSDSVFLGG